MKKKSSLIKSGISLVLLFVFITCISFSEGNDTPSVTKTFTLNEAGTLDVMTSGGKIKVMGQDGNKVEVQAFIRKRGKLLSPSDPYLSEIHEDYDFRIEQSGSAITAVAKRKENRPGKLSIGVAFTVLVPHQMSCKLKTSGGGISVSGVEGEQSMHTSGGGIKLSEIKGNVDAKTSGGGIKVMKQNGNINLHTSGGGISIEELRGNVDCHTSGGRINIHDSKGYIKGKTSGGPINLEDIEGDVEIHTSGGGIDVNGVAGYVKATTSGGGIDINIKGLNKELYLQTSGGGIDAFIPGGLGLDLDLKGNHVDIDLQNFSGTAKKGKVAGTMNGGGIPVYMHTSGGGVDVIFQ